MNLLPIASTGASITSIIQSSHIGSYFKGLGVDEKNKKIIDQKTIDALSQCKSYGNDFMFHSIKLYARPIQEIGTHIAENNDNDNKQEEANKNNAYNASQGYHHGLLILSHDSQYEPIQYVLDRVEGVRFIKVHLIESELESGHLILIKQYTNINIKFSMIEPFIRNETKKIYNLVTNNCLHFVYKFIDEIINRNEWDNDFSAFWEFIRYHFDTTDIQKGKFNQSKNDFVRHKKLSQQQKIKLGYERNVRKQWKIGDKVLVRLHHRLHHFKGVKSWVVGQITQISAMGKQEKIIVEYVEMDETKTKSTHRYDRSAISPYIKIPLTFLDPITNKIMTDPVQILKSGMIYDAVTVKYLQQLSRNIDPITGVLISIGRGKPIVMRKKKLKKAINKFTKKRMIRDDFINTFKDVQDKKLWQNIWQQLYEKYDFNKQQQKIHKNAKKIFYAENDGKSNENEDADLLQWDSDLMYINHTSVPIVTCMGPSRIGKSFLLNAILKNKDKDSESEMKHEIFETSNSGNTSQTKGAWISLYGDNMDINVDEVKSSDFVLIDQIPEDDIEMWSANDIISWFKSLNPKFLDVYHKLITYILKNDIDGKSFYKLNDINLLTNELKICTKHAKALVNIVSKRLRNKTDEIEMCKVNQMYLLDMEGLSHGVTEFTKKLFEACYAVSNVVIWYDNQVMSDSFKKLMHKLQKNMQVIVNSNRKPSFLYLLRNSDRCVFDFTVNVENDYGNYANEFDKWINNHDSCKWLRDMDIFSSVHGYSLHSPTFEHDGHGSITALDLSAILKTHKLYDDLHDVLKQNEMDLEMLRNLEKTEISEFCKECGFKIKQKLRFRKFMQILQNETKQAVKLKQTGCKKIYYEASTLNDLMNKVKAMTDGTARFANNLYILNDQINHINKDSELSLEKRIAACNSKLRWFLLSDKDGQLQHDGDVYKYGDFSKYEMKNMMRGLNPWTDSDLQVKNAIIKFNGDKKLVEDHFIEGLSSLEKQLQYKNEKITPEFRGELIRNKDKIVKAIESRAMRQTISRAAYAVAAGATLIGVTVGTGGLGSAALLAAGATTSDAFAMAFVCGYVGLTFAPKTSDKTITETDLTELEFYE